MPSFTWNKSAYFEEGNKLDFTFKTLNLNLRGIEIEHGKLN